MIGTDVAPSFSASIPATSIAWPFAQDHASAPGHTRFRWEAKSVASRCAIGQCACTFLRGAMCAAVDDVILFDTMSDDPASAMRTDRSKFLDCAFEAVERIGFRGYLHFESLVVVIPALIASGHSSFLLHWRNLDQPAAWR